MASSVFRSPYLLAGILVWSTGAMGWTFLWFADRPEAVASAVALGTFLLAGKVVAITAGLSLGGSPWIIGFSVFVPDFGALLFVHPFTGAAVHHLSRRSRFVRVLVDGARQGHSRGQGLIARHGAWGLFAIALVPIGFYSPLVIATLGQLVGLTSRRIVAAVGSAIAIMTTTWVVSINAGLDQVARIDPRLPLLLSLTLTGLVGAKFLIQWLWRRRRRAPMADLPPAPQPALDMD